MAFYCSVGGIDDSSLPFLFSFDLKNIVFFRKIIFLLVVSSHFLQDCEDSNPLIRALAVRTMGCIRVDKITEYLCEPLRKCLKDEDPYVRKTAAVCVAKLYDISSSMVRKNLMGIFFLEGDSICILGDFR